MDIISYFKYLTGLDPTESQKAVLLDFANGDIHKLLISAGRQSGKTLTTAVAILWFAFESGQKCRILLVSAQDNILYFHIREIFKTHLELEPQIVQSGTYSLVPLHGFELTNGNMVYVRGATDKQIRGLPADLVILDEAADIKSDIVLAALGNLSGTISKFVLLSTPHVANSLFVKWATEDPQSFKVHQWSAENLSWHNPVIEATKKAEMSPAKYAIEVLGRPPSAEERTFFPSKHLDACIVDCPCTREGGEHSQIEIGLDWGFDPCLTVMVVTEKLFSKRKVLFIKYWHKKSIENIAPEIGELIESWNPALVKADDKPAEYKGQVEKFTKHKINYISAPMHKALMMSQLQRRVRQHQLIIPDHFTNLVLEMRKYHPKKRTGDDLVDALCISAYEPVEPFSTKPTGRVIFREVKKK